MVAGVKPYICEYPKPLMMNAARVLFDYILRDDYVVAEFGAGNSTIWLAERCARLVSAEHDCDWAAIVREALHERGLSEKVELYLVEASRLREVASYYDDKFFDLIFVDCYGHQRYNVIKDSLPKLKSGGWLVLDDPEQDGVRRAIQDYLADWDSVLMIGRKPHPASHNYVPARTQFFRKGLRAWPDLY